MSRLSTGKMRLAAGLAVLSIGASVAVAVAGPAQAAVPNQWGFALVTNPAAVLGTPAPVNQAGSWPATVKVTTKRGAPGQVFVVFPHIASAGGVVQVSAVNPGPVWCQAQAWRGVGPNEVVAVRCYRAGGAAVFSPFSVTYSTSNCGPIPAGRAYGYAVFSPGHGLVASFNSSCHPNVLTAGPGPGVWTLTMPGLGFKVPAGGVQVSAVNPAAPARCELNAWTPAPAFQRFQVSCFGAGLAPLNTGWALTYQRGRAITGKQPIHFAYTFNTTPLAPGPYAPAPPGVNFNSLLGVNTIANAAGRSLARFPRVAAAPDNALVTGFRTGPGFCNMTTRWVTHIVAPGNQVLVRDVACYTAAGTLHPFASLISYTGS
jgi:hypothetical protein